MAYEGGATLTVEGVELGPGDLKVLRDFQPPAGTKPGAGPGGCLPAAVAVGGASFVGGAGSPRAQSQLPRAVFTRNMIRA